MNRPPSASAARALAFGLGLSLLSACTSNPSPPYAVEPPQRVPDLVGGSNELRLGGPTGRVTVVAFGYTSCPDICPTTLARLRAMSTELGERAQEVAVAFVSVDPPRDTRERLESYVAAFDPSFRAIRLDGIALARVLGGFGITVRRNDLDPRRYANRPEHAPGYSIDHTGGYFVVDRQGRLRFRLPHDAGTDALVNAVAALLSTSPARMRVESARAQLTPSGAGAVYLKVTNETGADDVLLSVRTAHAGGAQLHEIVSEKDVLRMVERPDGFPLGAGATLELNPGGKHVMLFGVEANEARTLELELVFQSAPPVRIQVPAARLAGAQP